VKRALLASCAALLFAGACGRDVTSIGATHLALPDAGAPDAMIDAGDAGESLYLEAEEGVLTGLSIEDRADASGGRSIVAPDVFSDAMPGEARATYAFELSQAGDYKFWGRVYAPDVDANRFWLQLDGGAWFLWRISTGEVWYWDDVHENRSYGTALTFALAAGPHELAIANAGPRARLDRWYISSLGDEPPGNDTPCNPPHTVELSGECVPSCGLLMGTGCGDICQGREPLPAYDCGVCCQVD
jgi:hypothetical protein